jgi:uncharacterized SAM-binding protein YcdF (DUF218 family)
MPRRLILVAAALLTALAALARFDPPHSHEPARLEADAVLVMSGDVGYVRLQRAVAMLREGAAAWLVLTGAGSGGDSAATMRELAVGQGILRERILAEDRATTTYENLQLAAPLLRAHAFRRVALITNASHLGRAERVARKALPEIRWVAVPVADPGPASRVYRTRLQEWAKLAWYAARGWI